MVMQIFFCIVEGIMEKKYGRKNSGLSAIDFLKALYGPMK